MDMQDLCTKKKTLNRDKINKYQNNEIQLIVTYNIAVTDSVKTVSPFCLKDRQGVK